MTEQTTPRERVPAWVSFLFAVAIPLTGGVAGYGALGARVTALEDRVDRSELATQVREQKVDHALEALAVTLAKISERTARICARVKCGEGPE